MTAKQALKEKGRENVAPFRAGGIFGEMERRFESMLPHGWLRPTRLERGLLGDSLPQIDVVDRGENVIVRAAVPGMKKEDLEVSATDNTVTIGGRSSFEEEEETGEYYRREIGCGSFLRTVSLPATIDADSVKAVFKNGLLELTLRKAEGVKGHRIEIEAEKG